MAVHLSKHMVHLLFVAILTASAKTQPTSKPGCPTKCGNVTIPYPFGTTKACSLNSSFLITCNTNRSPHTPFWNINNQSDRVRVLGISLDGELNTPLRVASQCVNKSTGETIHGPNGYHFNLTPFHLSSTRNKLIVVGAQTAGVVNSDPYDSHPTASVCVSLSNREGPTSSCSGVYCCQTDIPQKLSNFTYFSAANVFNRNASETDQFDSYPCGYAFLVENESFNFSNFVTGNNITLNSDATFPVVVDWAVGQHNCQHVNKSDYSYACKSDHSECSDVEGGHGYRCNCSTGFHGNPYLQDGCIDVDECSEKSHHDCVQLASCINSNGSYSCPCPNGYEGDGKNNGTKCTRKGRSDHLIVITLSVSATIITVLGGTLYVCYTLKKKKFIKLKAHFFEQNGGLLLQQQMAKYNGSSKMTKVFTDE